MIKIILIGVLCSVSFCLGILIVFNNNIITNWIIKKKWKTKQKREQEK